MNSWSLLLGVALVVLAPVFPATAEQMSSPAESAIVDPESAIETTSAESMIVEPAPAVEEPSAPSVQPPIDQAAAPDTSGEAMDPSPATVPPESNDSSPPATGQEDFEDPGHELGTAPAEMGSSAGEEFASPTESLPPSAGYAATLGPVGYDRQGRRGRVHTVLAGDTLWDISEAYLGTPWVWPSVWNENQSIANPHLIEPGDRIWVTSNEMRRVSEQEAEELLSADAPPAAEEVPPLSASTGTELAALEVANTAANLAIEQPETVEMAMDQLPVSVPIQGGEMSETGRMVRVSSRESMSFVSGEALAAASTLVDSSSARIFLSQGDPVFLGLGAGEVEVGDHFTVFRDADAIRDLQRNQLLGYHVRVLGWVEVEEVHAETATARIRLSVASIERGDRILPREKPALEVVLREAPPGVDGRIVYLPDGRTLMGTVDYVYLNLGSVHGIEVGTSLDVLDLGSVSHDRVRYTSVKTPDLPVANLVVVSVKPDSCVAFVASTTRELEVGDVVRGTPQEIASR